VWVVSKVGKVAGRRLLAGDARAWDTALTPTPFPPPSTPSTSGPQGTLDLLPIPAPASF
jgi:hypothetical protein